MVCLLDTIDERTARHRPPPRVFGDARMRLDQGYRHREVQPDHVTRAPVPLDRQVAPRLQMVARGFAVDLNRRPLLAPGRQPDGEGEVAFPIDLDRHVAIPRVARLLAEPDGATVGE